MPSDKIKPSDIFHCRHCGDCCKGFGGTVVTEADIKAIAEYVKEEPETFVARYCQPSGKKLVLAQAGNGYCIFWNDLCAIHPVKPRMCRRWPFIEGVLADIRNWQVMAGVCPGIRTDIPDRVVRECVKKELADKKS